MQACVKFEPSTINEPPNSASNPKENSAPAKIPVVQGLPESHLRPETNPRYLSECQKVAFQQLSNLYLAIFGFLQDVSLVSFLLGNLPVAHLCPAYFGRWEKAHMLPQLAH